MSGILIAAMIAVSAYGFSTIPPDVELALHWGLSGEPDGFSPRGHILVGLPLLAAMLASFFTFLPNLDPRKGHILASSSLWLTSWIGALAILLSAHLSIVLSAANGDYAPPLPAAPLYVACLMVMLIGNFTAKSRSNFFLGIRTPWTLSSEHAWGLANRTGGWLFVLSGAAGIVAGLASGTQDGFKVLIAGILAAAFGSVLVSYFAWRNDPEHTAPDRD